MYAIYIIDGISIFKLYRFLSNLITSDRSRTSSIKNKTLRKFNYNYIFV